MASTISLTTVRISSAIAAPIGCSVSVEMNRPIAPSAVRQATM